VTTITLVQAVEHDADKIHLMTAQPMNVNLTNLAGGAIQFRCSNIFATVKNAKSVNITYDASVPQQHQIIEISSVFS
jgi:hypothetical protein